MYQTSNLREHDWLHNCNQNGDDANYENNHHFRATENGMSKITM